MNHPLLTCASLLLVVCSLGCRDDSSGDASGGSGNAGAAGAQGGNGATGGLVGGMGTGAVGGSGVGGAGGAGAMGGAGGAGAMGGAGGFGGSIAQGGAATIVTQGDPSKVLLRGWVVTSGQSFDGEVLMEGETLTCVAADCSGEPGAATASIVQTNGIILPGMIDTHNHILFNIMDEDDWAPMMAYANHNQWPNEARYSAMIDTKQYLNGEAGSPINLNCELEKYGELKALIAGTTSVLTSANPANKVCYRTLARTIDQSANGLCGIDPPQSCPDGIQANTLFPSTSTADSICANLADGSTDSYVVHIGEGTNQSARDELEDLRTVTTTDGCLHDPKTVIVHGTAFLDAEFDVVAAAGMGITWSPASNVSLYGAGTDLSKTTNIPLALSKGIKIALSPDWSMGGSQNLLDELRFADLVDNTEWGNVLTPEMLLDMVTKNAAELLAVDDDIGTLEVGKKADVVVIGGDSALPFQSILEATPDRVRLVFVGGKALYGSAQLEPIAPQNPGCEALDVCTAPKFVCVAHTGGTGSNKWGQTLPEITTALNTELAAYDAMDVTQWDFAPITPLVKCP